MYRGIKRPLALLSEHSPSSIDQSCYDLDKESDSERKNVLQPSTPEYYGKVTFPMKFSITL